MDKTMKQKTTEADKIAAKKLKAAFRETKPQHKMTYDDVAEKMGITTGAVSHYFNGVNALNVEALLRICELIPGAVAKDIYPELFVGIKSLPSDDPKGILNKFYSLDEDLQSAILTMIERQD